MDVEAEKDAIVIMASSCVGIRDLPADDLFISLGCVAVEHFENPEAQQALGAD